jgi:hypothetical protein
LDYLLNVVGVVVGVVAAVILESFVLFYLFDWEVLMMGLIVYHMVNQDVVVVMIS